MIRQILHFSLDVQISNPNYKCKDYLDLNPITNFNIVHSYPWKHKKSYSEERFTLNPNLQPFNMFQSNQKEQTKVHPPGIKKKLRLQSNIHHQSIIDMIGSNIKENQNNQSNSNQNNNNTILGDITNQLKNVKINYPSSEEKKKNKKPVILENSRERFEGKLKFFDEQKNYGFIVMDKDETDAFVHFDDLRKANISKDFLRTVKSGNSIRFSFNLIYYTGKYNKSRKAIDLELLSADK